MTAIDTGVTNLEPHLKEDEKGGIECCAHHQETSEGLIRLYLVGFVLVFITTLTRWMGWEAGGINEIPAAVGAVLLGAWLVVSSLKEILKGRVSSSTLAAIAIVAAFAIGKYEAAGYLAFILLIVDQALRRTAWGARRAIEELVHLTPETARRVNEDGTDSEVPLGTIQVGMVVRVRPGENLPVDGTVVNGRSTINQASLTGESMPVEAQPGTDVYAGTTNLSGNLDLRVTSIGEDTTIGKVAALIREAESTRTPRQLLIEQIARYFVPVTLTVALLVFFFTKNAETAITVLVVVCPSALLISSPTAMMAAFAAAARLGIMIKQTNYLESAASVDTVIFDKTGTLTTGNFGVSRLSPASGVDGATLLQAAADAEQHSNHPLARSIMVTAKQARITPLADVEYEEVHGKGVRARKNGSEILAGRASWLLEVNRAVADEIAHVERNIEGMTGVHIMRDGQYLGAVGLEDKLRYNARQVIDSLRELGARKIELFTGDRFEVAKRVGRTVGVDQIEGECLPEEKHDLIVERINRGRRVLMVGDGINDGPSLAAADVGVAMGLSGSDIATNSAGVALMNDDISRVPFLIQLARKSRLIVAQNIAASIVIALIGLVIAATGLLPLAAAALWHFLGDIFVIANSFRLVRFGEDFAATHEQEVSTAVRRAEREQRSPRRASARLRAPAAAS